MLSLYELAFLYYGFFFIAFNVFLYLCTIYSLSLLLMASWFAHSVYEHTEAGYIVLWLQMPVLVLYMNYYIHHTVVYNYLLITFLYILFKDDMNMHGFQFV